MPCEKCSSTSRGCTGPRVADEVQQRAHVPAARRRPRRGAAARVHQRLHGAGDEAVVHEEVLVDVETGIATLEIAGAVAGHAMPQREVLRARRRPDRVGLHEAERVERALQRGRREQAARDGAAPQVVEGHASGASAVASRRFGGTELLRRGHRLTWIALVLASNVPVTRTFCPANFSGVF